MKSWKDSGCVGGHGIQHTLYSFVTIISNRHHFIVYLIMLPTNHAKRCVSLVCYLSLPEQLLHNMELRSYHATDQGA